ncbi:hypothetical protein FSP39_025147 [Pinctada imbricata]|uniref:Failed axon connections-like protein n=1 Tax=Pinctada imbricata TaxID=66713 RepID=A0AA89BZG6_PINIB|nr:hypothetical protein FSP39_025147 [Pinctada imbricata]
MSGEPPNPRSNHPKWKEGWLRDVVYLHVFPRQLTKCIPNLSPFAMKLETWLIIHDIKYELIDHMGFSSKGQSPFIMFNEEEIPDTNFIIEYLSKYFNKDPDEGLTSVDKGIARAFLKMVEDSTSWSIFWYRYVHHPKDEYINYVTLPEQQLVGIGAGFVDRAKKHGIGRHTNEEIYKVGSDDIRAISAFLGDKKFLFGDKPVLADCSVFGILSQVAYVPINYPMRTVVREECPNLLRYLDRIKDTYWKHWDQQMN